MNGEELRALVASLPVRLAREVEGGHLVFLGEPGARETAELALALADEAAAVERELAALLSAAADT